MIDLNTKWNEYPSDKLYLYNGDVIYRVVEGTGDNLWPEDEEKGYVDYWMTEYYDKDGNGNGGQWLETRLIRDIDYTIQGVIDRMYGCDFWEDEWEVLDPDKGYEIFEQYEAKGRMQ